MKVYLSGPMTDVPDNNEPAFRAAAAALRRQRYEVVVPHELDNHDRDSKTWGDFMARDIKLIADGDFDGIVLLPGWEKSKGARLELTLMLLLGKTVYEYYNGVATGIPNVCAAYLLKEAL
jgi:nucleoside 2-deoxyribosyltransferase